MTTATADHQPSFKTACIGFLTCTTALAVFMVLLSLP